MFYLPAGRPALDFFAGVASFGVLGSENEAVLVVAGVWCREEIQTFINESLTEKEKNRVQELTIRITQAAQISSKHA